MKKGIMFQPAFFSGDKVDFVRKIEFLSKLTRPSAAPDKPDTGFSSLLGRWEKDTLIIYKNSIFNGDIVFDLGANFGIHSMYYSKLVQNKGKVFAFEPLESNIKDLETHISINKINNSPTALFENKFTISRLNLIEQKD